MENAVVFHSLSGRGKEDSGRCGAGKARRNPRSEATGLSLQGDSGTSQRKRRYGLWFPNDAERLYRNKGWELGRVQRRMKRKREFIRMDPRVHARSLWESGERGSWTSGCCAGNPDKKVRTAWGRSLRQSVEGDESPCRMSDRIATVSPWGTTSGGYRPDTETATTGRRGTAAGGARCVEANVNGKHPPGFWWCISAQPKMRQKFSERMRSHSGCVKI